MIVRIKYNEIYTEYINNGYAVPRKSFGDRLAGDAVKSKAHTYDALSDVKWLVDNVLYTPYIYIYILT